MQEQMDYEVDLDSEKVRVDGNWYSRQDLAEQIKQRIESQDFRIATFGNALEHLQNALSTARQLQVKLTAADADRLERHARRAELATGTFLRQAVLAYLAAQPPLEAEPPAGGPPIPDGGPPPLKPLVTTTITTEPASPAEEAEAVELTDRKSTETSKVVVDPSLVEQAPEPGPEVVGDSWFKKG